MKIHDSTDEFPADRPRRTPTRLLTVEEVARQLSMGRTTVFGLIARGELPSMKIGASRRIPDDAVEAYIQSSVARSLPE